MLSFSSAVQQGGNQWKGIVPPHFFFWKPSSDSPPARPQQGVLLGHKSPGSLNHAADAPLAFFIAVVLLHLYSIREINDSGHGTQVDILLWGTWMKCHMLMRMGHEGRRPGTLIYCRHTEISDTEGRFYPPSHGSTCGGRLPVASPHLSGIPHVHKSCLSSQ